jgi:exopolysaccharide production protein ExoZ
MKNPFLWSIYIGNDKQEFEFLRGAAAILVFLSHADHGRTIDIPMISAVKGEVGALGVAIFFIISGYLIYGSASRNLKDRLKTGLYLYTLNRITRILPLYVVNIFFCCLFLGTFIKSSYLPTASFSDILRHLTFTQAFEPDVSRHINPVLWTLSYEALYYALVPFIFLWLKSRMALFCAAGWIVSVFSLYHPIPIIGRFLDFFFLFASGIFMAEYNLILSPVSSVILCLLGFISVKLLPIMYFQISEGLIAIGIFSLTFTLLPLLPGYKFLTQTNYFGIAWIGRISYSLYIWHYILLNIIVAYFGSGKPGFDSSRAILSSAFIIFFSFLSYRCIELPGMTHLRTLIKKRVMSHKII